MHTLARPSTVLLFSFLFNAAFGQSITLLQKGEPTSIRGLSVVDDSIAWVSGSRGYFAHTRNGGKTWDWQQIRGFEKSDFRDIEAFSDKEAIVMSSGTPALILKTIDGGASWQVKYKNTDSAYFFDAMAFANNDHGFVLGDPIAGKFVLMESKDNGDSWSMFSDRPNAIPGEAAFAASGTCLRVHADYISIVSGGRKSRSFNYWFDKKNWDVESIPVIQGKASEGTFSFADGRNESVFVGGNYADDALKDSVAAVKKEIGIWMIIEPIEHGPAGYQSCVEYLDNDTFVSTGTPGSNITTDGGKTWRQIDTASYNVCRKAKNGKLVLLAGNNGAIGILNL